MRVASYAIGLLIMSCVACSTPHDSAHDAGDGGPDTGTDAGSKQPDMREDARLPTRGVGTDPCLCGAEQSQDACVGVEGCAWLPDATDCRLVGELITLDAGCAAHSTEITCARFAACAWEGVRCASKVDDMCSARVEAFDCQMAFGCDWQNDACAAVEALASHLYLCGARDSQVECEDEAGCYWVDSGDGEVCVDGPNALRATECRSAVDTGACSAIDGCYWEPLQDGGEGCVWTMNPSSVDGFTGIDIYGVVEADGSAQLAEANVPALTCLQ